MITAIAAALAIYTALAVAKAITIGALTKRSDDDRS